MTAMSHNKPLSEDPPLVTFALFAYNQEKYIREAVEGAFAQTYEPLEIILSDDCSTDRTFGIMEQMVAAYNGPHNVILNKNNDNMGISTHVRKVHKISRGELIIHAAGDDISLPGRTEVLARYFFSEDNKPSLLSSNANEIDESGNLVGLHSGKSIGILRNMDGNPLNISQPGGGCSFAIHRALVESFNDPIPGIVREDALLLLRAKLVNGILYIPEVLLNYRINSGGVYSNYLGKRISNDELRLYSITSAIDAALRIEQAIIDITKISPANARVAIDKLKLSQITNTRLLRMLQSNFVHSTVNLFLGILNKGSIKQFLILYLARWFPFFRDLHGKTICWLKNIN